jgi:hypothetical protein
MALSLIDPSTMPMASALYTTFASEGGKMDTRKWVAIDAERPCPKRAESDFTCAGYTFKGTSTTLTNAEGVSQMTIDGMFSWGSDLEYTRDTAASMELGWMIQTKDVEY